MDTLQLFFALAIFVAVVLLSHAVLTAWSALRGPAAQRIARRLQGTADGARASQRDVSLVKKQALSEMPLLQRLLSEAVLVHRLHRLLMQAGLRLNVAKFCLFSVACGAATASVSVFVGLPPAIAAPAGIAAVLVPLVLVLNRRRTRLARAARQLPDALDLMSRALRAGHALPSAIKMVGDEMSDPLAGEFRLVFDQVTYGVALPAALRNLCSRLPGADVGHFVVAVLIQRDSGGNLNELLSSLAALMRERLKLIGQIQVYSAEGRLSAWILGLLP